MVMATFIDVATKKAEVELADIFREFFDEYRRKYASSPDEMKAVNAIVKCRTAQRSLVHCGWLFFMICGRGRFRQSAS